MPPTEVILPAANVEIYMAGFVVAALSHYFYSDKLTNLPLMYLLTVFICQSWLHFGVVSLFYLIGIIADATHNIFR